jgi:hypothetical protein
MAPTSGKHSRTSSSGYQAVHQDEQQQKYDDQGATDSPKLAAANDDDAVPTPPMTMTMQRERYRTTTLVLAGCVVLLVASNLYFTLPFAFHGSRRSGDDCPCRPEKVPQYFQTSPELWPGPTATGAPAFLAQTREFDPTGTFVPNEPLQTSMPIEGMKEGNDSIFRHMAFLSPYFPSPGFGVNEYPLPEGAEIVQVQMLSRHGSRYPTSGSDVIRFGEKVANESAKASFEGSLAFLHDWEYLMGNDILVPKGRQELFDSGIYADPGRILCCE